MQIVYNAFNGRYADSPRAVHETWVASGGNDHHVWLQDERFASTFPRGVDVVGIGSPAAVAALESADVVVNNTHVQLDRWTKADRTFYLQTWHGTPLKRIHRAAVRLPPEAVMAELDLDISRWDLLVSQSPAATTLLRDAFAYAGPVLESGYPRNDVLLAPDRAERRRTLRAELGIADGTTAVLYAPTYRDDTVDDPTAADPLDVEALAARLGPGHVVLVRQHYYLFRRTAVVGSGVLDVSALPEIAELYLAADVLVTDYSSAVFDFAVTGKPIVFYLHDLERYRGELRGLTFDLLAQAPGAVVTTPDGLARALLDVRLDVPASADRYAEFRRRYCPLDDGRAAGRVVAALRAATDDLGPI